MKHGSYIRHFNDIKISILSINTILYTYKLKGDDCRSLYYISNALNEARELNNKVIVIGHIPLWVAKYDCLEYVNVTLQDKIIKIFNDNNYIITFKLYGHDHRSEVKNVNTIQLLTTPAISPIFGNNPGIRILKYDINKQILNDIQDYYIDYIYSTKNHLSKWTKIKSFKKLYDVENITDLTIQQTINWIMDDTMKYICYSSRVNGYFTCKYKSLQCIMKCDNENDLKSCMNEKIW